MPDALSVRPTDASVTEQESIVLDPSGLVQGRFDICCFEVLKSRPSSIDIELNTSFYNDLLNGTIIKDYDVKSFLQLIKFFAIRWKSRARLTPEGKAALTPENLLFLTPVKS